MAEPHVLASGIRKQFFRKGRESAAYFDAVACTDFELHAGQLVVLMGRSGSGKSTLVSMLAGLSAPTEGTVRILGTDLYALDDAALSRFRNEHVGMALQGQTALKSLTAVQNVMLPACMLAPRDEHEERALELLEKFGVRHLADAYPEELSGGELRRVAIARALMCAPDVILADEPTSDLDEHNTRVVLESLRDAARAGAAVLVVTHDSEAREFADACLRMDDGRLS